MKKLIIYGAGGNGEVAADVAKLNGYSDIVFIDDNKNINAIQQYEVVHKFDEIENLEQYDFFNAIGNNAIREKVNDKYGLKLKTLIHPTAVIGENVKIGEGTIVMANAVINPGCTIGKSCIVNTCSSIDHDCVICDYCHISVNAHLAGTVCIKERSFIGISSTISNNVNIASDVTIGAGSVVVKDINESGTYAGVPARKIK